MPEIFSQGKKKDKKEGEYKRKKEISAEAEKLCENLGRRHLLGSLEVFPEKIKFEAQGKKEVIVLLARAHVITNFWWVALVSFLVFVPLYWAEFPLVALVGDLVRFSLGVLWYLGLGFFVLYKLFLWYYNVYIITDERVVDIDFFGLLYKNINIAQIRNIEDVNYSQIGVFASLFNYGDVVIQTASEQRSAEAEEEGSAFTFGSISNPDKVMRILGELIEQEETEGYEGRVR